MAHYDVVLVRLIQYIQRRLSPHFPIQFPLLPFTVLWHHVWSLPTVYAVWWPSGKYKLCVHHHTNKMQPANFLDLSSRVIVALIARHVRWRIWMRLRCLLARPPSLALFLLQIAFGASPESDSLLSTNWRTTTAIDTQGDDCDWIHWTERHWTEQNGFGLTQTLGIKDIFTRINTVSNELYQFHR